MLVFVMQFGEWQEELCKETLIGWIGILFCYYRISHNFQHQYISGMEVPGLSNGMEVHV
jgi:hypothetical protein